MKYTESIQNIAASLKDVSEQITKICFSIDSAALSGDSAMMDANEDLLVAQLEFIQKAVIVLTEDIVNALSEKESHKDGSVFGPGDLSHVKGEENADAGTEEEELSEEVEE